MPPRKKKLEVITSEQLKPPDAYIPADPVKHVLDALYAMAVDGNTSAAKLWLDYHFRHYSDLSDDEPADEALKRLSYPN